MAEARYLFRLDDACPWMNHERWAAVESLFDRHGVKPVVAVVPACADPELLVADEDPDFWPKTLRWQAKGWRIGLHGYDHVFTGRSRGLVPLNSYTEFAGRPEAEQREKIRRGWKALLDQGLKPDVWIAPAHTFDRTTIRCLLEETSIRTISDGLSRRPFLRYGMTWIPQQLWRPRLAPSGTWTICLHPNEMDDNALAAVERFVTGVGASSSASIEPALREWDLSDGVFELAFRVLRATKKRIRKPK